MKKLAGVAVTVLIASCFAAGQVPAPMATFQPGAPNAHDPSQTDNGTGEILMFHSHARQVLVTALVWKHAAKSAAWVPKEALKRYPKAGGALAMPPVARGLSANDFRLFDNGAEQKINYLEESGFSWRNINEQWYFYPHIRGTWGHYTSVDLALEPPAATYIIGYTPPPSQSGDCHTIQVVAEDNDVVLNRARYCNNDEGDTATVEGSKFAAQRESLAQSGKRGSIKVSSQPFVFWSSRVLSLMRDNPAAISSASQSPPANYTYVVVVHDARAPATVQIATEYELGTKQWDYPCPSHAAIYVSGVVYKANGEVAARFGDSYQCSSEEDSYLVDFGFDPPVGSYIAGARWLPIPTRFNTQVELHPGDYDVHVVVSDGHKFGQARMPLRVEPIDGQALTISDIALNGILRDASWLLRDAAMVSPAPLVPSPLVSKHAQFIPVPDARLRKKSSLPLYFEIYEPLLADRGAEVSFRMKITDLKDGTVVMNAGPTSAAECVIPGNVVIPIALNVDTDKLQSGAYKIEVQALDSAGRTTEWRMAKFEIQ